MRPGRHILALAALAALALGGCGGGDSETTTAAQREEAPQALSQAELIARGDAICAEVNAAVGTVGSGSEVGSAARQVADIYVGMVEDLKALGRPAPADGYAEFIEAAERLGQAEQEAKLAAEREDTAALEAAEGNVSTALADFQSAAAAYGFEECGEEPSAPAPAATPGPGAVEGGEGGVEEGAVEAAPEVEEEAAPEVEEEVAPETGGAGEVTPEAGGAGEGAESGGSSGGVGPG